jgi:cation:H+ antiporter
MVGLILILIVSLLFIIWGASLLTDGSVALAERFKVPEFIVGLTIVAVGTSMPELTVSFMAAISPDGHTDMAIGNIVGSNIFNILCILGVSAVISPILFTKTNIRRDIPLCIAASLALLAVTLINEDVTHFEGLLLLLGYIAMIYFTVRAERKAQKLNPQPDAETSGKKPMPFWRIPIWIIFGLVGLIGGGSYFVDAAVGIAEKLNVPESTIAITLVAGGTSIPELASSVVSILKGRTELALGNVLGSSIANILLILGVCGTITPLSMGGVEINDVCIAVAAAVLVMISALVIGRDKMTRIEGLIFLMCYVAYVYYLICR